MSKPSIENLKAVRKYIKERPDQDPLALFQNIALYNISQLKHSYKDELKRKDDRISELEKQISEYLVKYHVASLSSSVEAKKSETKVEGAPIKNRFERSAVPVMYLIVRESLGMSPGKVAAQAAHGAVQITTAYYEEMFKLDRGIPGILRPSLEYYEQWAKEPTKIVLRANEEEWKELKEMADAIVVDGGYTEIPANSETVLAFWPMRKDLAPEEIKRLPLV